MNKDKNVFWYDDGGKLTTVLVGLILLIIILSQSFAINNNLSAIDIFSNIINHNTIYLLMLVYFVTLKTFIGKKYFNHINCLVILMYFIMSLTSLLSVFHAFSLNSLLAVALNVLIFIYVFHVFLKDTRIWKEFKLYKSPFRELDNDWFFSTIVIICVILLAVNLISTTTLDGTFLTLLDSFYIVLFSRYIYLYNDYLVSKNPKKETAFKALDDVKDKVEEEFNKIKEAIKEDVNEEVKDASIAEETKPKKSKSSEKKKGAEE